MHVVPFALLAATLFAACSSKEPPVDRDDDGSSPAPDDSPDNTGGAGGAEPGAQEGGQGNTDDDEFTRPPASELKYAPCKREQRLGGFIVELAEKYTSVQGQVLNGVVDANVPDVVAEAGECTLLKGQALFCDPGCAGGEMCTREGQCAAHPENVNLGTVTVHGMKDEVVMEARAPINLYASQGTLIHPGFSPGDVLSLDASGAEGGPFDAHVEGIAPMEVPDQSIAVTAGSSVSVTWTASAESPSAKVQLDLNVNNHGSLLAWIECHVPDTGSFEIPSALVEQLLGLGASGFPTLAIHRRSAGSVTSADGCIEFEARSGFAIDVELDGLTSCNNDDDCAMGQTCQGDLTCQ